MSEYLIDSNLIIDVLKGQQWASDLLVELAPRGLSISIITYGELYEGVYYDRDSQKAIADLPGFMLAEHANNLFFAVATLAHERLPSSSGGLSLSLDQIPGCTSMDFLIASTAKVHDMTLVTRNLRDFQHIPDIRLYALDTAD